MVQLSDTKGEDWDEMAKIYKQLTVDVSSRPIGVLLEKANALLPLSEASAVHDNGCGPGPVMARLIQDYGSDLPENCSLSASDFSAAMIAQVEKTKKEEVDRDPKSHWARVGTSVLDAMNLEGIKDGSKSHVTAGWVYFMTPSPEKCLSESFRVLKSGGVLSCSSWQDSEWIQLMNLVKEVKPDVPVPEIPAAWKTTEGVTNELQKAGFQKVEATEVEVSMAFDSHEAMTTLLTKKMPHMVKMLSTWSAEEKQALKGMIEKRLKEMCPESAGRLKGVAVVGAGQKP